MTWIDSFFPDDRETWQRWISNRPLLRRNVVSCSTCCAPPPPPVWTFLCLVNRSRHEEECGVCTHLLPCSLSEPSWWSWFRFELGGPLRVSGCLPAPDNMSVMPGNSKTLFLFVYRIAMAQFFMLRRNYAFIDIVIWNWEEYVFTMCKTEAVFVLALVLLPSAHHETSSGKDLWCANFSSSA
jgi:hypothetical protein